MLNKKEIQELRSKAQFIKPLFQIGKNEINENMIKDILNYLNKNELLKISILQNSLYEKDEVVEILENNDIEVVQVIGRCIIVYKESDNCKHKVLER